MEDQRSRLSRRTMIIGLAGAAGVAAAGGAVIWLKAAGGAPAQGSHLQATATGTILTNPLLTYRGHQSSVTAVAWHDTRVASGSNDKTVQVWDANTGATLLTYRGHTNIVGALSWSPDGQKVVSSQAFNGLVHVWDARSGATLLTYRGHQSRTGADTTITDVAWAPNGKWIASSSVDETVQVWDAASGATLLTYRTNPPQVMGTAEWSPESTRIASLIGQGSLVHIWAAMTGNLLVTIPGDGALTIASRWSPDGTRLATSGDSGAYVWDATTGKQLLSYTGYGLAAVNDLAWSPDGKYLASDAVDVQVWEATTGQRLLTYREPQITGDFYQLAWAPDGKRIAVGASDTTVQIFQAP